MLSTARARPEVSGLSVIEADEFHATLSYLNLIVVLWYNSPRAESLHQLYSIAQRITAECGVAQVSVVSIVQRKLPEAPSPAARAALGLLHSDPKNVLYRSALVFVNEGFIVASMRSILLGVRNKLSGSSNNEIFKDFETAARWAMDGLIGPERQALPVRSIVAEVNRYLTIQNDGSSER
jgi:hypothetical protein